LGHIRNFGDNQHCDVSMLEGPVAGRLLQCAREQKDRADRGRYSWPRRIG
jgi:hypothetical protein